MFELSYGAPLERRQGLADAALIVARASDDEGTLLRVLNDISFPLTVPELLTQNLTRTAEALALAERLGDPALLAWSAHIRAGLCLAAGDVEAMHRHFALAWQLGERLDHPFLNWQRVVMRCLCALVAGDIATAVARATEAIQIGTANGEPDVGIFAAAQIGAVNVQRGGRQDAASAIEQFIPQLPGLQEQLTAALAWEHARCDRLTLASDTGGDGRVGLYPPAGPGRPLRSPPRGRV